jgi:hypothetical protein
MARSTSNVNSNDPGEEGAVLELSHMRHERTSAKAGSQLDGDLALKTGREL